MRLRDKRAVVTGASRGIGESVARALVGAGARVCLLARTPLEQLAQELDAEHAHCDVTDESSVKLAFSLARERLGGIDILVNNAGIASSAPAHKESLAEWERLFAVNTTGTFLCSREVVGEMTRRGWGRIVNVASVAGTRGGRYIAAYSASKHAVLGFTRSLALEVAAKGVTVNAVCPGFVETPMTVGSLENIRAKTGRSLEEARASLEAASPQNRLLAPDEVAHAVVFLCEELSRGINGQALVLDGGETLAL